MIRFACPACRKVLKSPDHGAGRKITCPKCGRRVEIPQPASLSVLLPAEPIESAEAIPPAEPFESDDYPDPPQPGKPAWFVPVIACVSVLSIAGAVLLAVALSSGGAPVAVLDKPNGKQTPAGDNSPSRERGREPSASDAVGAGLAGMACFRTVIFACVVYVVLVILLMAWVARDCRARGVDGGAVWVLLIFFTGFVGFLVYMASRPDGVLVPCSRCNNRRLMAATLSPPLRRQDGFRLMTEAWVLLPDRLHY